MLEHVGLDWVTVEGRFFDDGHIADTAHRHVQRAGDRGRGEGEDIDVLPQFLEMFLLSNAEALFLVDDGESQITEFYVLLHQSVGADDHIDLAASQLFDDLLLLVGRAEAGEQLYADRITVKAVQYGLVVLPRKDRGGAEQGALLAVGNAFEGGAQGNLRFAEADVAAEQSVHRDGALHIVLDLVTAAQLIFGLFIGEACFKVVLPFVVA